MTSGIIHTYIPTYIYTYIPTYIHTYVRTYTQTHIHTFTHTSTHAYTRACVHSCILAYVHTYLRTYIHTTWRRSVSRNIYWSFWMVHSCTYTCWGTCNLYNQRAHNRIDIPTTVMCFLYVPSPRPCFKVKYCLLRHMSLDQLQKQTRKQLNLNNFWDLANGLCSGNLLSGRSSRNIAKCIHNLLEVTSIVRNILTPDSSSSVNIAYN
jgi:hypothetical protein